MNDARRKDLDKIREALNSTIEYFENIDSYDNLPYGYRNAIIQIIEWINLLESAERKAAENDKGGPYKSTTEHNAELLSQTSNVLFQCLTEDNENLVTCLEDAMNLLNEIN